MNKCKSCGANCEKEYCFKHKPRKGFSKTIKGGNVKDNNDMWMFFLIIWKKRKHISEVSGEKLGKEPLSTFFHHILSKEKYPQAKYDEDNIILLTFEEHENVELDIFKYEEINKRRSLLKIKYNIL